MYEGTRMAREEDFSGIRKIIHPLEESGVLVRRTDKEVIIFFITNKTSICSLVLHLSFSLAFYATKQKILFFPLAS
jgi:N-acetylglutamate synthase-like GNAT family acetyltransferase